MPDQLPAGALARAEAQLLQLRQEIPARLVPPAGGLDHSGIEVPLPLRPEQSQLISATKTVDEVCEFIGADTLAFLSVDALLECVPEAGYCIACFTGEYPVAIPESFGRDKFIEGYVPRNLTKPEPVTGCCVSAKAEDKSWELEHPEA